MNITANEILLLDRNNNMNLRNLRAQDEPEAPVPASDPKEVMNALDMQGRNNIAFTGLKANSLKHGLKTLGLFGALAVVTPLMNSCKKEPMVTQIQNVEIDLGDFMAQWQAILDELAQFHQDVNDRFDRLNDKINELYQMYQQGLITRDQFYEQVALYMQTDEQTQADILAQLQANGMTEQEARNFLAQLLAAYQSGQITAQQYAQQILNHLQTIEQILQTISGYVSNMAGHVASIDNKMDFNAQQLASIVHYDSIIAANVPNMANDINIMKNDLNQTKQIMLSLNSYLQDTSIHITRSDVENWMNQLNITIDNAAQMTVDDLRTAFAGKLDTIIARHDTEISILQEMNPKLNYLSYFPHSVQTGDSILASLNELKTYVQNLQPGQQADYTALLQQISNQLTGIKNSIDQEVGLLNSQVTNFNTFYQSWTSANATTQQKLTDVITLGQNANSYLANLTQGVNNLNTKANNISNTNSHIAQVLDSLAAKGYEGMTFDQFSNFMSNTYSQQQYNNLLNWWGTTGMSSLPSYMLHLSNMSDSIHNDIIQYRRTPAQLDTIISLINGARAQAQQNADSVIIILNGFDFCGCQQGNGNNESVIDSLNHYLY